MLNRTGAAPMQNAIIGSQGPAPGIRRPARTDITPAPGPNLAPGPDGSITYRAGRRAASSIVTSQPTIEPVTPLKTLAEGMRGGHVDAQA